MFHAWPVVLVALALIALFVTSRRRRRARAPSQAAALGAYLDLTDALAPRGHPLVEHATPREYLRGVSADPAIERAVVDEAEVVQVLHAFDVPRRRDLAFSMVSSVILMAEAGALSLSSSFVLLVIRGRSSAAGGCSCRAGRVRPSPRRPSRFAVGRRRPVERRHRSGGRCGWERPSCSRPCSSSWASRGSPGRSSGRCRSRSAEPHRRCRTSPAAWRTPRCRRQPATAS